MKNLILTTALALALTACASERVINTQTDKIQVEVSASAPDRRADAVFNGAVLAAQATLDRGFDLFIIKSIQSDATSSSFGAGANTLAVQATGVTSLGGILVATLHSGEASLEVQMFHYGEKGSEKALDARKELAANQPITSKGNR